MSLYIPKQNKPVNVVDTMGTMGDQLNPITGRVPAGWAGNSLNESGVWNPGSVGGGAIATTGVSVSGARVGDKVEVNFSPPLPNQFNGFGYVSAPGTGTITIANQGLTTSVGATTALVTVHPQLQSVRNDGEE